MGLAKGQHEAPKSYQSNKAPKAIGFSGGSRKLQKELVQVLDSQAGNRVNKVAEQKALQVPNGANAGKGGSWCANKQKPHQSTSFPLTNPEL